MGSGQWAFDIQVKHRDRVLVASDFTDEEQARETHSFMQRILKSLGEQSA
jgi:hypothetical protein